MLAQQRKTSPTVAHTLDQLQFVDLSLDDAIVLRQGEADFHRSFVSLYPGDKTAQFWDLTGVALLQEESVVSASSLHRATADVA